MMIKNICFSVLIGLMSCNMLSSQVLLDPDQKLLDDYKWIYNTSVKHACKTSDKPAVIETPIDKCNFIDDFSMYPNPASDILNVKFKAKERPTIIYISNIEGQLIETIKLDDFVGTYNSDIRLSSYMDGMYVMTIRQGDETFIRQLIVKR